MQADNPPGIMVVDLGDVVLPANSTAILDVIYSGMGACSSRLSRLDMPISHETCREEANKSLHTHVSMAAALF